MNDPFPDCSILNIDQRSERWHQERLGRLTASKAEAWLVEEPKCRLTIKEITAYLEVADIEFPKRASRDDLLKLLVAPEQYATHTASNIDHWHKTARKLVTGKVAKMKIDAGEDVSLLIPPFPHYVMGEQGQVDFASTHC